MNQTGTYQFRAVDAGYAFVVNDNEYAYFATRADNKPFGYFVNPAVWGSAPFLVRWDKDEGDGAFVKADASVVSHLDDRYGVGADYATKFYGRPPFGASTADVLIALNTSNLVPDSAELNSISLEKKYTNGVIVPYLVVKVYEERLASHDYYTWLGAPLDNSFDAPVTKQALIDELTGDFLDALNSGGSIHTAYQAYTGLSLVAVQDLDDNSFTVSNMARFDGQAVLGEHYNNLHGGHLGTPDIVLPGLTRAVGHQLIGFRPMRGAHTVFAPEKLNDLNKALADTLVTLNPGVDDAAYLQELLSYGMKDFFQDQGHRMVVRIPRTTKLGNVTGHIKNNELTMTGDGNLVIKYDSSTNKIASVPRDDLVGAVIELDNGSDPQFVVTVLAWSEGELQVAPLDVMNELQLSTLISASSGTNVHYAEVSDVLDGEAVADGGDKYTITLDTGVVAGPAHISVGDILEIETSNGGNPKPFTVIAVVTNGLVFQVQGEAGGDAPWTGGAVTRDGWPSGSPSDITSVGYELNSEFTATLSVGSTADLMVGDTITADGAEFVIVGIPDATHLTFSGFTANYWKMADEDFSRTTLSPVEFQEAIVKAFFTAHGNLFVGGTVTLYDLEGNKTEVVNSAALIIENGYSNVTGQFEEPNPLNKNYVTGPYGAQGLIQKDGSIVWLSDAYTV